eukprot:5619488-Amphidinium_carterae.2
MDSRPSQHKLVFLNQEAPNSNVACLCDNLLRRTSSDSARADGGAVSGSFSSLTHAPPEPGR